MNVSLENGDVVDFYPLEDEKPSMFVFDMPSIPLGCDLGFVCFICGNSTRNRKYMKSVVDPFFSEDYRDLIRRVFLIDISSHSKICTRCISRLVEICAWKNRIVNRLTDYSKKYRSIQCFWRDIATDTEQNVNRASKRRKATKKKAGSDSTFSITGKIIDIDNENDTSGLMDMRAKRWQTLKTENGKSANMIYDVMVVDPNLASSHGLTTLPEEITVTNEIEVVTTAVEEDQQPATLPTLDCVEEVKNVESVDQNDEGNEDAYMDHLYCAGEATKEHGYELPPDIDAQYIDALKFINPYTMERDTLFQCMTNIDQELCSLTLTINPSILRSKDIGTLLDKQLLKKVIIEMRQRAPFTFALLSVLVCPLHFCVPEMNKVIAFMYGMALYCRNSSFGAMPRLLSLCVPFKPAFKEVFDVLNSFALSVPYQSVDKIRGTYGETNCDLIRQQMVRWKRNSKAVPQMRAWIQHTA